MDLYQAGGLAINLMKEHKLTAKGWRFAWTMAEKSLGVCKHSTKRIGLSKPLTARLDETEVRQTILHEISHALAGPHAKHGPEWKAMCLKVGAKPERCYKGPIPSRVTFPEEPEEELDEAETTESIGPSVEKTVPAPDSISLLSWDSIRPELEKIYRIQLMDDDPLRMVADVVRIVLLQSQSTAAVALKNHVDGQLADFHKAVDIDLKARLQEGHTNILKLLTIAQGQLKSAETESVSRIRKETAELGSAARDLRSVNRSMRTHDWFVGAIFMAGVLLIGIMVGVIYGHFRPSVF